MNTNKFLQVISTEEAFEPFPKKKTVQADSCVLTSEGLDLLIDVLSKLEVPSEKPTETVKGINDDACNDDELLHEMKIPAAKAGLVIGAKGSNIRHIGNETNTSIRVVKWTEETVVKRSALIRGKLSHIELAKVEIYKLIDTNTTKENVRPEQPKVNERKLCHFYLKGNCWSGNYCTYSHAARPKSHDNDTSGRKRPLSSPISPLSIVSKSRKDAI